MADNFPYPIPSSWYAVVDSGELERGQVLPLELLGRKLVAMRTEDGTASVLEAFCPHLGAHLGYGGVVEGSRNSCKLSNSLFISV